MYTAAKFKKRIIRPNSYLLTILDSGVGLCPMTPTRGSALAARWGQTPVVGSRSACSRLDVPPRSNTFLVLYICSAVHWFIVILSTRSSYERAQLFQLCSLSLSLSLSLCTAVRPFVPSSVLNYFAVKCARDDTASCCQT